MALGSRKKFKKCFYYRNAYRHEAWKGGDLLQGASTFNITRPFKHMKKYNS